MKFKLLLLAFVFPLFANANSGYYNQGDIQKLVEEIKLLNEIESNQNKDNKTVLREQRDEISLEKEIESANQSKKLQEIKKLEPKLVKLKANEIYHTLESRISNATVQFNKEMMIVAKDVFQVDKEKFAVVSLDKLMTAIGNVAKLKSNIDSAKTYKAYMEKIINLDDDYFLSNDLKLFVENAGQTLFKLEEVNYFDSVNFQASQTVGDTITVKEKDAVGNLFVKKINGKTILLGL